MALGPKTENAIAEGDGNTQVGHNSGTIIQGYSIEQHEAALDRRLAEQRELLERAHGAERQVLLAKISDLETKLANPEASLKEAQKRIADLEALLDREGNEIGSERIDAAKAAMEAGDYSLADEIFAEIEAREEIAVQRSARATFGRGEVAEAEVRWHDAYAHYKRAAQLHETEDHLGAYGRLTWRLAKGQEAVEVYRKLVVLIKGAHGEQSPEYATQLNNFAEVLKARGEFFEAEDLYRQALEIDRDTIGAEHPDYAAHLSNLAGVVEVRGLYSEAEDLYRQALKICGQTIGEEHPDYATLLNNLANVLRARREFSEAEELLRQALEIGRQTIGEGHPNYATRLNNLAVLLEAQGDFGDAEELYRRALEIGRQTIGEGHPKYAIRLCNLADTLAHRGNISEAREMWHKALAIMEAALPADHPNIAVVKKRLDQTAP